MTAVLPPAGLLQAWDLRPTAITPLGSGLINETWLVHAGQENYVLQSLNPVFPPEINLDIEAVTARLRTAGLEAPRLLVATNGQLWWVRDGRVWRLMTWIDGVSHDYLGNTHQAASAGGLLGRFHRTLDGFEHVFRNPRLGVHDTQRHLAALGRALQVHAGHADFGLVEPLATAILAAAGRLPPLPELPDRVVHGDPKVNNILFDRESDEAICLIDLDTLSRMPLPLELGDAFRSWCNPAGEDRQEAEFSLDPFAAAVDGYARAVDGWITPAEVDAIVPATLTIYVELAARFCADALNESYFGWDPARYASCGAHNRVRAASQLAAAQSLERMRDEAEEIVRRAFKK